MSGRPPTSSLDIRAACLSFNERREIVNHQIPQLCSANGPGKIKKQPPVEHIPTMIRNFSEKAHITRYIFLLLQCITRYIPDVKIQQDDPTRLTTLTCANLELRSNCGSRLPVYAHCTEYLPTFNAKHAHPVLVHISYQGQIRCLHVSVN